MKLSDSTDDSETEDDWTEWNPMLEEFTSPLNTYDFNLESDSDGEPRECIRKKEKKKKVCRYSRSKNGCVHGILPSQTSIAFNLV